MTLLDLFDLKDQLLAGALQTDDENMILFCQYVRLRKELVARMEENLTRCSEWYND
jgi:hypothetical protein